MRRFYCFRQKIKECDAQDRACAESENQMQSVLKPQCKQPTEHCRDERSNDDDENHARSILCRLRSMECDERLLTWYATLTRIAACARSQAASQLRCFC